MTFRVRVSPKAEADLTDIYEWYEQAQPGLGSTFLNSVDVTLRQVAEFPASGRLMHTDTRRVLMRRFPYGLSYVINEDDIFVLACFHLRRDPDVWRSRDA